MKKLNIYIYVFVVLFLLPDISFENTGHNEPTWYLGCFYIARTPDSTISYSSDVTSIVQCCKQCSYKSYPYAFISSKKCRCSEKDEDMTKVAENMCNYNCEGDNSFKCGGKELYSAYRTEGPYIQTIEQDYRLGRLGVLMGQPVNISIQILLGSEPDFPTGLKRLDNASFSTIATQSTIENQIYEYQVPITHKYGLLIITHKFISHGSVPIEIRVQNPIGLDFYAFEILVTSPVPNLFDVRAHQVNQFFKNSPSCEKQDVEDSTQKKIQILPGDEVEINAELYHGVNMTFSWDVCGKLNRVSTPYMEPDSTCHFSFCKFDKQIFEFNFVQDCLITVTASNDFGVLQSSILIRVVAPEIRDLSYVTTMNCNDDMTCKATTFWGENNYIPDSFYGWGGPYADVPNTLSTPKEGEETNFPPGSFMVKTEICFHVSAFITVKGSTSVGIRFGDGHKLKHSLKEKFGFSGRFGRSINPYGELWGSNSTFVSPFTPNFERNSVRRSPEVTSCYLNGCILNIYFSHTYTRGGRFNVEVQVSNSTYQVAVRLQKSISIIGNGLGSRLQCPSLVSVGQITRIVILENANNNVFAWSIHKRIFDDVADDSAQWQKKGDEVSISPFFYTFQSSGMYFVRVRDSGSSGLSCNIIVEEEVSGIELKIQNNSSYVEVGKEIVFSLVIDRGSNFTITWEFFDETFKEEVIKTAPYTMDLRYRSSKVGCHALSAMVQNTISSISVRSSIICFEEKIAGVELITPKRSEIGNPVNVTVKVASGSNLEVVVVTTCLYGTYISSLSNTTGNNMGPSMFYFTIPSFSKPGSYNIQLQIINHVTPSDIGFVQSTVEAGITIRTVDVKNQYFDIEQSVVHHRKNVLIVFLNGFVHDNFGVLYTWKIPQLVDSTKTEVKTIFTTSPIIMIKPYIINNTLNQVIVNVKSGFNDVTTNLSIVTEFNAKNVGLFHQHIMAVNELLTLNVSCSTNISTNYSCQVFFSDNNESVIINSDMSKSVNHTFLSPGLWTIEKRFLDSNDKLISKIQSYVMVQQKITSMNLQGSTLLHVNENSTGYWNANTTEGGNLIYSWSISKRSDHSFIYKQATGIVCREDFFYTFSNLGSYNVTLTIFNDVSSQTKSLMVDVQRQTIHYEVNVYATYINHPATFFITLNTSLNCNISANWGDESKTENFILNEDQLMSNDKSLSTYSLSHEYNHAGKYEFLFTIQWVSGSDFLVRDNRGSVTVYNIHEPPIQVFALIEQNQTKEFSNYLAMVGNTIHLQANITEFAQSVTWVITKENAKHKNAWYGPYTEMIYSKEIIINSTSYFEYKLHERILTFDFLPEERGAYTITATLEPGSFLSEIQVFVYSPLSYINFEVNKIYDGPLYRGTDDWCVLYNRFNNFLPIEESRSCNPLMLGAESDGVGVVFEYTLNFYFNVWNSSDTKVTVIRVPGVLNNFTMKYNGTLTYRFKDEGNYSLSCTALSMDFDNASKVISRKLVSRNFFTVSSPDVTFTGQREIIMVETNVPYNFTLQRKVPGSHQRIFVEWRMDLREIGQRNSGLYPSGNTVRGLGLLVYPFTYGREYARTTRQITVRANNEAGTIQFSANVEVVDRIQNASLIIGSSKTTHATGKPITLYAFDEPNFPANYITWFINDVNNNITTMDRALYRIFTISGIYTMWFEATNAINTVRSEKIVLTVVDEIPFSLTLVCPPNVKFGENMNISLANIGNGSPDVMWDMGDGNLYFEEYTIRHFYSRAGVYLVRVTVSNQAESFNRSCEVFVMEEICEIPYVVIANVGDPVTHFPYKRIRFEAMVHFNCSYVKRVNYRWRVKVNDGTSNFLPGLNGDNQVFELAPYSLVADRYMVLVNVTLSGTVLYATYQLYFHIQSSYPTARISGKTVGTFSRSDNIVIDGSPSYTMDDPPNEKGTLMRYSWECYVLNLPEKSCFWNASDLRMHEERTFSSQNIDDVTRSFTTQQSFRDLKLYEKFPIAMNNHNAVLDFPASVLAKDEHIFVFRLVVNIHVPGEPGDYATYILNIEDDKSVARVDLVCPLCTEPSINRQSVTVFGAECTNCVGGRVDYLWTVEVLEDDSRSFYANESSNCAPPDGSGWVLFWSNNGTSNESITQDDINKDEEDRIMRFNRTDSSSESNGLVLHEDDKNFTGIFSVHNNIPGESNGLLPQYNAYDDYGSPAKLTDQDIDFSQLQASNLPTALPQDNNLFTVNKHNPPAQDNTFPVNFNNNPSPYHNRLPNSVGSLPDFGDSQRTWIQGDNSAVSNEEPSLAEGYGADSTRNNQYSDYGGLSVNPYAPLDDSSQYMDMLLGLGNGSLFGDSNSQYGDGQVFSRSGGFYNYNYLPIQEGEDDGRPNDGRPNFRGPPFSLSNYQPPSFTALPFTTTTLEGDSLLNPNSKTGLGFTHYQDKKHTTISLNDIVKEAPGLSQYLIIKKNSLNEGKTYAVTAHVTHYDLNGSVIKEGQAGYYVRINRGPSYGQCSVSESHYADLYRVHCIGWKTKQYYIPVKQNKESELVYYDISYSLTEDGLRRALYYGSSYDRLFALPASHNEVYVHVKLYNGEGDRTYVCSFPVNVTRENRTDINDIRFVYNKVVGSESDFHHILIKRDDNDILSYTNVMLDSLPKSFYEKHAHQSSLVDSQLQSIVETLSNGLSQIHTNGVVRYTDVLYGLERLAKWHVYFTSEATEFIMKVIDNAVSSEIIFRHNELKEGHFGEQQSFINLAREINYEDTAENVLSKILVTLDALSTSFFDMYSQCVLTNSTSDINETELFQSMNGVHTTEENLRNYFLKSSRESISTFGSNKVETPSIYFSAQLPEQNLTNVVSDKLVGAVYPMYLINALKNYEQEHKYTLSTLAYLHQCPFISNDNSVKMDSTAISLWITDNNDTEIEVDNLEKPLTIFLPPRLLKDNPKENSSFSVYQGKMAMHSFKVEKSNNYTLHIQVEAEELTSRPFAVAVAFSGQPLSTKSPLNDTNILSMSVFSAKRARSLKRIGSSSTVKLTFKPGELDSSLTYYVSLWNANSETTKLERRFSHQKVNYRINVWWSDCFYWDQFLYKWRKDGCQISNTSTLSQTICQASHLSTYSSSFERIEAPLQTHDLILIVATRALSSCLTVLLALFVFFFGFLAIHRFVLRHREHTISESDDLVRKSLGVGDWLRWWLGTDDHGASGRVPIILQDNKQEHKQVYEITLQTGNWPGSGTTSLANVILYGEKGKYEARELIAPFNGSSNEQTAHFNHCRKQETCLYETGSTKTFIVTFDCNLGSLWKVAIWHDHFGKWPRWYLDYVNIKDVNTEEKWFFPCHSWLALDRGVNRIYQDLTPMENRPNFGRHFAIRIRNFMIDYHSFLSIFSCAHWGALTRSQRIVHGLALCVVIMALSTEKMILVAAKNLRSDYSYFSLESVTWGLAIGALSSLLLLPAQLIFRYSKRDERISMVIEDSTNGSTESPFLSYSDLALPNKYGQTYQSITSRNAGGLHKTSTLTQNIAELVNNHEPITSANVAVCDWLKEKELGSRTNLSADASKLCLEGGKIPGYAGSVYSWPIGRSMTSFDEEIARCMMASNDSLSTKKDFYSGDEGMTSSCHSNYLNESYVTSEGGLDDVGRGSNVDSYDGAYLDINGLAMDGPALIPCAKLEAIPRRHSAPLPRKCAYLAWVYYLLLVIGCCGAIVYASAYIMEESDFAGWVEISCFALFWTTVVIETLTVALFAMLQTARNVWSDADLAATHAALFPAVDAAAVDNYAYRQQKETPSVRDISMPAKGIETLDATEIKLRVLERRRSRYLRTVLPPYDRKGRWRKLSDPLRKSARILRRNTCAERASATWFIYFVLVVVLLHIVSLNGTSNTRHLQHGHVTSWFERGFSIRRDFTISSDVNATVSFHGISDSTLWRDWFERAIMGEVHSLSVARGPAKEGSFAANNILLGDIRVQSMSRKVVPVVSRSEKWAEMLDFKAGDNHKTGHNLTEVVSPVTGRVYVVDKLFKIDLFYRNQYFYSNLSVGNLTEAVSIDFLSYNTVTKQYTVIKAMAEFKNRYFRHATSIDTQTTSLSGKVASNWLILCHVILIIWVAGCAIRNLLNLTENQTLNKRSLKELCKRSIHESGTMQKALSALVWFVVVAYLTISTTLRYFTFLVSDTMEQGGHAGCNYLPMIETVLFWEMFSRCALAAWTVLAVVQGIVLLVTLHGPKTRLSRIVVATCYSMKSAFSSILLPFVGVIFVVTSVGFLSGDANFSSYLDGLQWVVKAAVGMGFFAGFGNSVAKQSVGAVSLVLAAFLFVVCRMILRGFLISNHQTNFNAMKRNHDKKSTKNSKEESKRNKKKKKSKREKKGNKHKSDRSKSKVNYVSFYDIWNVNFNLVKSLFNRLVTTIFCGNLPRRFRPRDTEYEVVFFRSSRDSVTSSSLHKEYGLDENGDKHLNEGLFEINAYGKLDSNGKSLKELGMFDADIDFKMTNNLALYEIELQVNEFYQRATSLIDDVMESFKFTDQLYSNEMTKVKLNDVVTNCPDGSPRKVYSTCGLSEESSRCGSIQSVAEHYEQKSEMDGKCDDIFRSDSSQQNMDGKRSTTSPKPLRSDSKMTVTKSSSPKMRSINRRSQEDTNVARNSDNENALETEAAAPVLTTTNLARHNMRLCSTTEVVPDVIVEQVTSSTPTTDTKSTVDDFSNSGSNRSGLLGLLRVKKKKQRQRFPSTTVSRARPLRRSQTIFTDVKKLPPTNEVSSSSSKNSVNNSTQQSCHRKAPRFAPAFESTSSHSQNSTREVYEKRKKKGEPCERVRSDSGIERGNSKEIVTDPYEDSRDIPGFIGD